MYTLTSQLKALVLVTTFLMTTSLTMLTQAATSCSNPNATTTTSGTLSTSGPKSSQSFCELANLTGGSCLVIDKNDPSFGTLFESAVLNVLISAIQPAITAVSPQKLPQGSTLDILINAPDANFNTSSLKSISIGGGVTVNPAGGAVLSPCQLVANVSVPIGATTGMYDITVDTSLPNGSKETVMGLKILQLMASPSTATILSVTPLMVSRQAGSTEVTIYAQNSHFDGTSTVDFGDPAITVTGKTVYSYTKMLAVLNIANTAKVGFHKVTVKTGNEVAQDTQPLGLLQVFESVTAYPALTNIQPDQGRQGETLTLDITAKDTHFAQGASTLSFEDASNFFVLNTKVVDATHLSATVKTQFSAALGARNVSVTTGTEIATIQTGFTVFSPAIVRLTEKQGRRGEQMQIHLNGEGTHFVSGKTQMNFEGTGITTLSTNVIDATTAVATILIDNSTTLGSYQISVVTGGEVAVPETGEVFEVIGEGPRILSLSPNQATQGDTLTNVTVTGGDTHFINASSVKFPTGSGIRVVKTTLNSPTSLTLTLEIADDAPPATQAITVSTDPAENATLANAFTVKAAVKYIVKVSAKNGKVTSNISGLNCGSACVAQFKKDTSLTLTATADENYQFVKWTGDCNSSTNPLTFAVTADKTCDAQFASIEYGLTVTKQGKGTVTSSLGGLECNDTSCQAKYPKGTTVTLLAEETGATFLGWRGDCMGTGATTVLTLTAAKTCVADFGAIVYPLQINVTGNGQVSSGDGINCNANGGETCKKDYLANTTVKLTATPNANSTFTGWSIDCAGTSSSTTIDITNVAKSCTATFDALDAIPPSGDKPNSADKTAISTPPTGTDGTTTITPTTVDTTGTTSPNPSADTSGTGVTTATTATSGNDHPDGQNNNNNTVSYNLKVTLAGTGTGTITSKPTGLACSKTNEANCTKDYPTGTAITLIAKAEGTSTFKSWGGDCTDTQDNLAFVTIDAKKTCTATFEMETVDMDSDGDRITNTIEDAAPNQGDGNADNTPDSHQAEVISLPRKDGSYLTIASKTLGCNPQQVKTTVESDQPSQDTQYDFPNGLVSLELPATCDEAQVKLYYHGLTTVPPKDWGFRAYDATTQQWNSLNATFKPVQIAGQPVVTVSLLLQNDHGKFVGGIGQPVILPKLQFSQAAQTIDEYGTDTTTLSSGKEVTGTLITIKVTSTHGIPGTMTVPYQVTSNGTTTLTTEYLLPPSKTLIFADGAKEATIAIFKILMGCKEQNETLTLQLSPPTGSAELGTPDKTTITIKTNENKDDCTCKNGPSSLALKDPTQQSLTLKVGSEPTLLTLIGGQGKRVLDISPNTIVTVAPETLPDNGDVLLTLTPKQEGKTQLTVKDECNGEVKVDIEVKVVKVDVVESSPLCDKIALIPDQQNLSLVVGEKKGLVLNGEITQVNVADKTMVDANLSPLGKCQTQLTLIPRKKGETKLTFQDRDKNEAVATVTIKSGFEPESREVTLGILDKPVTFIFTGGKGKVTLSGEYDEKVVTPKLLQPQEGQVQLELTPRELGETTLTLADENDSQAVITVKVINPECEPESKLVLKTRNDNVILRLGEATLPITFTGGQGKVKLLEDPDGNIVDLTVPSGEALTQLRLTPRQPGKTLLTLGDCANHQATVNITVLKPNTLADLCDLDKRTESICQHADNDKVLDLNGSSLEEKGLADFDAYFGVQLQSTLKSPPKDLVLLPQDKLSVTVTSFSKKLKGQAAVDFIVMVESQGKLWMSQKIVLPTTPPVTTTPNTQCDNPLTCMGEDTKTFDTGSQPSTNTGRKPTPDAGDQGNSGADTTSTLDTGSPSTPDTGEKEATTSTPDTGGQPPTKEVSDQCATPELELWCKMGSGTKSKPAVAPKKWRLWNGQLPTLTAAATLHSLAAIQELPLELDLQGLPAGEYTLYVGYRLQDGTIIFNGKSKTQPHFWIANSLAITEEEKIEPRTYFDTKVEQTKNGEVSISLTIKPDQGHLGQVVDMVMVASYTTATGETFSYMRTPGNGWLDWDGATMANLQFAQKHVPLEDNLPVDIFQGDLSKFVGTTRIYVGYEMQNGVIIFNGQAPIEITIP